MWLRRLALRFYTVRMLREERADALIYKAWLLQRHVDDDDPDMRLVNGWLDDVNAEFQRRGLT